MQAADLRANEWYDHEQQVAYGEAKRRGQDCFDFSFYLRASPDQLGYLWKEVNPMQAAWEHFLGRGILDGRPYRYLC